MGWAGASEAETAADLAAIERDGYVIVEGLLGDDDLAAMRAILAPLLARDPHGRNDFEGHRTQRVYSLVARGPIFAEVVAHPRILAVLDALLMPGYQLSASQAICIHPGETPQPLHTDDSFYPIPRPRPPISVSTIWAIDAFSRENGGTEVIPGSHRWSDDDVGHQLHETIDFTTQRDGAPLGEREGDRARRARLVPIEMPAGSVVVFAGTLVHRGGANGGAGSRWAFSNQYCEPWARAQENFALGMDDDALRALPERVRRMLGFEIHPPFMGHVRGRHPDRLLGL